MPANKVVIGASIIVVVIVVAIVAMIVVSPGSTPAPARPPTYQPPTWAKLDSSVKLKTISSGNSGFIFGISTNNQLFFMNPSLQMWRPFSMYQSNIGNVQGLVAAAQDGSFTGTGPTVGSLWVANTGNGLIYRWNNSSTYWTATSGNVQVDSTGQCAPGSSLSVASASSGNAICSIGNNGLSYVYSNSAWSATSIYSLSASIGTDFSLWTVGMAGNLNTSQGNSGNWTGLGNPGNKLSQVSCSSASRVFVLDANASLYQYSSSGGFVQVQGVPSNIIWISCGKECVTVLDSSGQAWICSKL